MAYVYCDGCDAGQDEPTFAECMKGAIECHQCGQDVPLRHDERNDALIRLEERLAAVEDVLLMQRTMNDVLN